MDSGVDTDLLELRSNLRGREQLAVLDYWCERRGSRRMPARADLDPLALARLMPNIMLVETADTDCARYRYRLVGTRVVQATGEDRTGRHFAEVAFFRQHPEELQRYAAVAVSRRPVFTLEPFTNQAHGTTYDAERLMLPLGRADDHVDMILAHFRFCSGPYRSAS